MIDNRRLSSQVLCNLVRAALAEDIGSGDATTMAVIPEDLETTGYFRTRQACVVAGMPVVEAVFAELDRNVIVESQLSDNTRCQPGDVLAVISGPARALVTGERTALNYLQRLTGIATLTRAYVDALGETKTRLLDTRKTTPGLRALEKYAVTAGGGENHRFGLFDMIMIKDNHCNIADLNGPGGITKAIERCRTEFPQLKIEVEADTFDQVKAALKAHADYVLLDNMGDDDLREAVALRDKIYAQCLLEASGGITIERMPAIGASGVDYVSVGALTHSAPAIDIGLDFDEDVSYP